MAHPLDLHKDRLGTTDEEGDRIFLHPLEVKGFFRRWRHSVYAILMLIFLITPWTKINGVQTILLDLPRRRFSIFGFTFWAHDAPMLFFVIAGTAFSLAFAAAVWGRVWCGWACPQTVFIDVFYRRIETWFEGSALERRANAKKPMTPARVIQKIAKWMAFAMVSLVISHSFLAYFVGAERMLHMIQGPPAENIGAFFVTFFVTALVLFDFGWFREQFCVIMCPYGRLQSILMDKHSLTVMYDRQRGEPRRGLAPATGDCVDCFKCVSVCPTGIDIRRGLQLECIGCTACIDACDEIMEKVHKPKGLIRYDRLSGVRGKKVWLRPAPILYTTILCILVIGFTITVSRREPVGAEILRAHEAPYADAGPGRVSNHFRLEFNNTLFTPAQVHLVSPLEAQGVQIITAIQPVTVKEGITQRIDFFVNFPRELLKLGRLKGEIKINVTSEGRAWTLSKELPLVGPIE